MARSCDPALRTIIYQVLGDRSINDSERIVLFRRISEAMEISEKRRGWVRTLIIQLFSALFLVILSVVLMVNGSSPDFWAINLVDICIILSIVLCNVYAARYRARMANLNCDVAEAKLRGKGKTNDYVPYICLVGPCTGLGGRVSLFDQSGGYIAAYNSNSCLFIPNQGGGDYRVSLRKASGVFRVKPNESLFIDVYDSGKTSLRCSANVVTQTGPVQSAPAIEKEPERNAPSSAIPKPVEAPKPQMEEKEDVANGLYSEKPLNALPNLFSIPKGKTGFFVSEHEVLDKLLPGTYRLVIDDFPRLKKANPDAIGKTLKGASVRLVLVDTDSLYSFSWETTEKIRAKGDVECKVSNPRLFLVSVLENELRTESALEEKLRSAAIPVIEVGLEEASSEDLEKAESAVLKEAEGSLNKLGMTITHIGITDLLKASKKEEPVGHTCIHCGKSIAEDMAFCPYCGKPQNDNRCANCGAEIPDGAMFCPKCGTRREQR